MPVTVDRYSAKRRLLRPVTSWRRHRTERGGPFNRAVFEAHDYRPALRRFAERARRDPDILVDAALRPGGVVVDVGAYAGDWTRRVLELAALQGVEDLEIHAFEPVTAAVDMFRASLGDDPRVTLHAFALGGHARSQEITVDGPGSSLYGSQSPARAATETVVVHDVDEVLRSLGLDHIDLMKINIEGGEYELIDRLHETGWLARCGPVIVQFHEFAPDAHRRRRRNRRQLSATHSCSWSYTWVYERWDPR
jgi:FkbM family methyltransferase